MKKKKVNVDYGESKLEITVPENATIIRCEDPPPLTNPEKAFREALESPIGMPPIRELAHKGSKVTIAFDAPPRSGVPKRLFIPILLEELRRAGVPKENVTLICATGTQWKRTRDELYNNLGAQLFSEFWPHRLLNHDCSQDLIFLGRSELGDYVEFNKRVAESDLVIYLGTIGILNWGGVTGTGVVIGLGSARCVRSTHTEVIAHPDSCHGDPRKSLYMKHKQAIHAQIEKATGKKIFYVDTIMNSQDQICSVFVGHCPDINESEWRTAEKFFRVPTPQADVLVVGLPIRQIYGETHNPILALTYMTMLMRTWINKPVLRPGGILIGMVKCNGTIDKRRRPSDQEVWNLFGKVHSALDLFDFEEEFLTREDYLYRYRHCHAVHPIHSFWMFYEDQYLLDHAGKIIFAGDVNPEAVRKLGCTPAKDFDQAWAMAERILGKDPEVVVAPDYMSRLKVQFDVK
jgi:nickel-dependent lactate racemase